MNYCSLVMKISLISLAGMLAAGCSSDSDPADTGNDDAETGADDGGNGNGDGDGNDDGADDGNDDGADDGNDDGADDGNDDGGNPIAGECDLGQRVGRFDVILEETYSAIDGEIREALVQTAVLTEAANEGGCRLIRSEFPFCDPPCGGGDACTEGGCVPFPARMEVGVVTITGLEAEAVMEPAADSRYFKTDLPHPAIVAGASIELHAEGGGGFTMQGAGFGALVATGGAVTIAAGTDVPLTWEPENGEAQVRIEINIDQHGTSPSTLLCDAPDTGNFTVPASVIDALISSGTSGFPSGNLYRQTVDSTNASSGCVEFRIRARTPVSVDVDGHTACTGLPDECPPGQTCNVPIQTCE